MIPRESPGDDKHQLIGDTAKRSSDSVLGTFYHESLHAQRFQTLFENIWVSNLIGELSRVRGSLLVNFSFLRHETT